MYPNACRSVIPRKRTKPLATMRQARMTSAFTPQGLAFFRCRNSLTRFPQNTKESLKQFTLPRRKEATILQLRHAAKTMRGLCKLRSAWHVQATPLRCNIAALQPNANREKALRAVDSVLWSTITRPGCGCHNKAQSALEHQYLAT